MSRLCEEFGCLPSDLEPEDLPLMLRILDYRAYSRAKQALDESTDETNAPTGGSVDDVWATEHELLRRRNSRGVVSE